MLRKLQEQPTININNTQQGTEDNKEIVVFDPNQMNIPQVLIAIGSMVVTHWPIPGTIATSDNTKDSIWSFDTHNRQRDYAVAGNARPFDGELDLDGLSTNRIQ